MSDCIVIRGLRLWAHVGVFEFERDAGQFFEVDIDIMFDIRSASCSDLVGDTADYSLLVKSLHSLVRTLECSTLELFAERIASVARDLYGNVALLVELRKVNAPLPAFGQQPRTERRRLRFARCEQFQGR